MSKEHNGVLTRFMRARSGRTRDSILAKAAMCCDPADFGDIFDIFHRYLPDFLIYSSVTYAGQGPWTDSWARNIIDYCQRYICKGGEYSALARGMIDTLAKASCSVTADAAKAALASLVE